VVVSPPTHPFLIGRRGGGTGKLFSDNTIIEPKSAYISGISSISSSSNGGCGESPLSTNSYSSSSNFEEVDSVNNYVAAWRSDTIDCAGSASFSEYSSLEVFAYSHLNHHEGDCINHNQTMSHTETTTTTSIETATAPGDCATVSTLPDEVMLDRALEERQDHENTRFPSPTEQRKSIFLFLSGSLGAATTPTPTIPSTPATTVEQFLEMEPSDIVSMSDSNSIVMADDHHEDRHLSEDIREAEEDTVLMSETRTRPYVITAAPAPLSATAPVSRCSSTPFLPRTSSSSSSSVLISPTRNSSTRSVVRTISLANEDVVVLEEPTDIRRVSFANNEASYVESDLPYLTEDDIARYFWGDRECLESRVQRRALLNTLKRHMRNHPQPQWTEEHESV
jgi:hypothetical protein